MSVTIKDIARVANVSHTTVSRALNDSPLINAETKDRIKKIADELGYTPNISAKSLVTHKSFNIGLFFTTLHDGTSAWFFQDVVRGVSRTLMDDYHLSVKGIDDMQSTGLLSTRNYDGIIVMSQSADDDRFIEQVLERNIPLVVLNRKVDHDGIVNIVPDDYQGAYEAVRYLISGGHRHIGLIEGKVGFHSSELRAAGYADALRAAGLEVRSRYRAIGNYMMDGGYEAMKTLLSQVDLSAVFCCNDDMAIGALKAVQDAGYSVPHDISLVGFDDIRFSAFTSPALTTVSRPIEHMGRTGAEHLLQRIASGKQFERETLYTHTELVKRHSVLTTKGERF